LQKGPCRFSDSTKLPRLLCFTKFKPGLPDNYVLAPVYSAEKL
jgi:hypothetical protein